MPPTHVLPTHNPPSSSHSHNLDAFFDAFILRWFVNRVPFPFTQTLAFTPHFEGTESQTLRRLTVSMWESTWDALGRPKPKPWPASPGTTTNSVMLRQPDAHQELPASTLSGVLVAGFKHCLSLFQPQKTAMLPLHHSNTNPPPQNNESIKGPYYLNWSRVWDSPMKMVNRHRRPIVPKDIEQAETSSLDERQPIEMAESPSTQEVDVSPKPEHHPVDLIGVGSWGRHQSRHGGTNSSSGATANSSDREPQVVESKLPRPTSNENEPDTPSQWHLPLSRRCSSPTNSSLAESIFSHPSSRVSSATSLREMSVRSSSGRTRCESLRSENKSSASSMAGPHDLSGHHSPRGVPLPQFSTKMNDNDVKIVQSFVATSERRVYFQDHGRIHVTDWIAQERGARHQDEGKLMQPPNVGKDAESTNRPCLSTIREGGSDAGQCPKLNTTSERLSPVDTEMVPPCDPSDSRSGVESISVDTANPANSTSGNSGQQTTSSATSVSNFSASTMNETTEDEASLSDVTDETDESLYEACIASSLPPNQLPIVLSVYESVVSIVTARVLDWVRSCSPEANTSSGNINPSQYSSLGSGNGNGDRAREKRSLEGDGPRGRGREDDDDQNKRQKFETPMPEDQPDTNEKRYACPFAKKYRETKWPRCQKGGWRSVHRVKEHLYRVHKLPIHCGRCFKRFDNDEKKLNEHIRSDEVCDVVDTVPSWLLGIDGETEKKLKSGRGLKNAEEHVKWGKMYNILYPDDEIPSPYYEAPMSAKERDEILRLLGPGFDDGIATTVTNRLSNHPELWQNRQIAERTLLPVVRRAVSDYMQAMILNRNTSDTTAPTDHRTQTGSNSSQTPISTDPTPVGEAALDIGHNYSNSQQLNAPTNAFPGVAGSLDPVHFTGPLYVGDGSSQDAQFAEMLNLDDFDFDA